ncbi:galactose oxidase-like domain-containing protein [uncultured Arthrobacter sp.]|uniref:galactose oxidase-like domain-containing protein n=1 Tax=uncultured Arthrobacter sp. TaxID=114050 RepID=UPI0028D4C56F|nr:galactose oxidase-like domain-containing protein [uncultured Arthrobacter sp.]
MTASDEEVSAEDGQAANVLDGETATFWQSAETEPATPFPHSITIDTGITQTISGFRYLPRADVPNGRIGSFEIMVSTDGTTWGTPVARGTWADSSSEKSVTFAAESARFVRMQAISEAGDRGSWSSAAEINLVGQEPGDRVLQAQGVATGSSGSWGPTIDFPLVPAAAALLPGNRLLTWSANAPAMYGGGGGLTQTSILNLTTGEVTQNEVANTGHDMFCPGVSMLPDGRILVSGGSSNNKTTLYDPETNTWTAGPPMNIPRGYQSDVTTSTGEVFTIGGSWSGGLGNKNGELWSAAGGWRALPNVLSDRIRTQDPGGDFRADNHAWLFAAPGGRVFHAGPSSQMNWISTTGAGTISPAGLRSDSPDAMNGNAVMYDVGKILTVGGATAYSGVAPTAKAYTIEINSGVRVAPTGSMAFSRQYANGVALPDGQVIVIGGKGTSETVTDTGARMSPEIWNPETGLWTTLAPMAIPRAYHSVATLLPDGRVFAGGGGLCAGACNTNHLDGQIFTPPYLLDENGAPRARPKILSAPTTAENGTTISVTTGEPITKFSLMRMSTVTHSVNTDQRRIPLTATSVSGNTASLNLPADPGVLVPGNYLLFAMNDLGVPSVATTIGIGAQAAPPSSRLSIGSAADTVAAGPDGTLWNYRPTGQGGFQPREKIGSGWAGLAKGFVTDWNVDGVFDIIAQWKDGRLRFYPGKTGGGFAPAQEIGSGWATYHIALGRWRSTDKYPSILAYDHAGTLWHYGNSAGKTLSPRTRIGTGWNGLYLTMADFDQDGKQDLLAKRSDGNLLLYRSTGAGSFMAEPRPVVGTGWNVVNSITKVSGFTPGKQGLISRLTDGRLAHYPFSNGKWGARTILGSGWSTYNVFR